MSGRSLVVIAGNRQLSGGSLWAALFLLVWGGIFGGVPLAMLAGSPRGAPGFVLVFILIGGAAFCGGLYLLLRWREVRFDPMRRQLEHARGFFLLGIDRVEHTPLAAFEGVSLEAVSGSKGGTTWRLALRGPNARELSLGDHMGKRGNAVAAALRAAAATGLPLFETEADGDVVCLRPEQVAKLAASARVEDDGRAWWRRPSAIALVVANLIPIGGVLWWDWEILPLMLLFWLENLIVGLYTIARMLRAKGGLLNLPFCAFFAFHYGLFCAGHGLFILTLFGPKGAARMRGPTELRELVGEALFEHGLLIAALALLVSHGVSFVTNYLRTREYEDAEANRLMLAPFGRIVVLHLVLLGGGFFVLGMGAPLVPLVALIVLKIVIDLAAHLAEHRAPLLREYKALAETAGVATLSSLSPNPAQVAREAPQRDGKPLSHYLGSWRLAPGEHAPPGWFAGIDLAQNGGKLGVHLITQPDGTSEDTLVAATVRGDASRVEWIEVRLRGGGRAGNLERILRFTAAAGERVDLHEIQQPAGNPRAMQAKSFTLVRA